MKIERWLKGTVLSAGVLACALSAYAQNDTNCFGIAGCKYEGPPNNPNLNNSDPLTPDPYNSNNEIANGINPTVAAAALPAASQDSIGSVVAENAPLQQPSNAASFDNSRSPSQVVGVPVGNAQPQAIPVPTEDVAKILNGEPATDQTIAQTAENLNAALEPGDAEAATVDANDPLGNTKLLGRAIAGLRNNNSNIPQKAGYPWDTAQDTKQRNFTVQGTNLKDIKQINYQRGMSKDFAINSPNTDGGL